MRPRGMGMLAALLIGGACGSDAGELSLSATDGEFCETYLEMCPDDALQHEVCSKDCQKGVMPGSLKTRAGNCWETYCLIELGYCKDWRMVNDPKVKACGQKHSWWTEDR